jgi:hypothetical protein
MTIIKMTMTCDRNVLKFIAAGKVLMARLTDVERYGSNVASAHTLAHFPTVFQE